jgi:hypothetical protein
VLESAVVQEGGFVAVLAVVQAVALVPERVVFVELAVEGQQEAELLLVEKVEIEGVE